MMRVILKRKKIIHKKKINFNREPFYLFRKLPKKLIKFNKKNKLKYKFAKFIFFYKFKTISYLKILNKNNITPNNNYLKNFNLNLFKKFININLFRNNLYNSYLNILNKILNKPAKKFIIFIINSLKNNMNKFVDVNKITNSIIYNKDLKIFPLSKQFLFNKLTQVIANYNINLFKTNNKKLNFFNINLNNYDDIYNNFCENYNNIFKIFTIHTKNLNDLYFFYKIKQLILCLKLPAFIIKKIEKSQEYCTFKQIKLQILYKKLFIRYIYICLRKPIKPKIGILRRIYLYLKTKFDYF